MSGQKYEVSLSRSAERMLLQHTEFLAQVSPASARRLISSLVKVKSRLSDNPYQYPFADDLDVSGIPPVTYRKCLFEKRYKALFLIEGNDVHVDAIIDCRQENKSIYERGEV
jgi:plasmid stabilization system protein ParE